MSKPAGRPRIHENNAAKHRASRAKLATERAALREAYAKLRQLRVYHQSQRAEWSTPQGFFDALNAEFHFTLDPCATWCNAKCPHFYTLDDDGLAQVWAGEVVFMNPPYGRTIGAWMRKAYDSARAGATVVCLVPARTDTQWWQDYARHGDVRFIPGRLKFGGAKNAAPFPSAVVIFHPAAHKEVSA